MVSMVVRLEVVSKVVRLEVVSMVVMLEGVLMGFGQWMKKGLGPMLLPGEHLVASIVEVVEGA